MNSFKNKKILFYALGIAGLGLLPFLLLSFFNHPTIDDFTYANRVKEYGSWGFQSYLYQSWSGRFSSSLVVGYLNPLTYDHWLAGIRVFPFLFITAFLLSFYFFLKTIFPAGRDYALPVAVFAALFLVCFFQQLETVPELVYWFTGTAVYGLAMAVVLLNFSWLIRFFTRPPAAPSLLLFGSILVSAVFLVGANEITMYNTVLFYFGVLVFTLWRGQRRDVLFFAGIFLVIVAAGIFSGLAPGNFKRVAAFNESATSIFTIQSLLTTTLQSGLLALQYLKDWSANLLLWAVSLFFGLVTWKYDLNRLIRFGKLRWIFLFYLGFFVLVAAQIFPCLLVHHYILPRVRNAINFYFILYWFAGIFLWVSYLRHNLKVETTFNFSNRLSAVLLGLILFLIFTSHNISRAYVDFFTRAARYNQTYLQRYQLVAEARKTGRPEVVVPPELSDHSEFPATIFFEDIKDFPDDSLNAGWSRFFRIRSIRKAGQPFMDKGIRNKE